MLHKWRRNIQWRGKRHNLTEDDKHHCACMCVCERETHGGRLGAVWVRGEAWATADTLVNEQTWRPPAAPSHSLLHHHPSLLRSSSLHCTLDPSPLIWLKLYINHAAPVPSTPRLHAYTHRACQSNVPYRSTYTVQPPSPSSDLSLTSRLVKLYDCLSRRRSSDEDVK